MRTFHLIDFCGTELPLAVWRETPWHTEEPHCHDCYELLFFCEGKGVHTLNGRRTPMLCGDCFLCTPADTHGYSYEKAPTFYNVLFSPSLFNRQELDYFLPLISHPCKLSFTPAPAKRLQEMLHDISAELSSGTPGNTICARAAFISFLVTLFRQRLPQQDSSGKGTLTQEETLLNCLQTSYRTHLTLDVVAKKIGMSAEYTRRMIKRMTGATLTENIRNYRLEEARLKLENTDMPIAELAESLGYYDISHFSKQFQALYQCSPTKYRDTFRTSDRRQLLTWLKERREAQAPAPVSSSSDGTRPTLEELARRRKNLGR